MTEVTNVNEIDVGAELEAKNASLLRRCIVLFNPIYVLWVGYDYLLLPSQASTFLGLRLLAAALNLCSLFEQLRPKVKHPSTRAFWLWFFVWGIFVAPMLALSGSAFLPYVMGLCVVLFGIGAIPYFHPRWAISNVVAICAVCSTAVFARISTLSTRDLITFAFFVTTVAIVATASASFRYRLTVKELTTRAALEEQQRALEDKRQALLLERQINEGLREAERARTAELSQALERLKKLDHFKTEFFASISHELRTPLTLVLAPLEQLIAGATGEGRERLLRIRRNASRLLVLIDELLDLSRLDAGGLRLNVAEVDLAALVATVHENSRSMAEARGIRFDLILSGRPEDIHGDAHRLESIVANLIGNAFKYTSEGGLVELWIGATEEGAEIRVRDTGSGISAEDLPHVFERFFQGSRDDRRRPSGVGIGLSLAKELTELHGGELLVKSELGVGSTFTLRLQSGREHFRPEVIERRRAFEPPKDLARREGDLTQVGFLANERKTEMSEPPSQPDISFKGLARARVLVVEDQPEMLTFIAELLQPHCDVLVAADGDAGLTIAKSIRPDLIISDVMMPGTLGTMLCRELKRDPVLKHIPVILLTAKVGSEATVEAYGYGADDFVSKPFHPSVLLARARAQLRLRALSLELALREKEAMVATLGRGILGEIRAPMNVIANGVRVLLAGGANGATASRLLELMSKSADDIDQILVVLEQPTQAEEPEYRGHCDLRRAAETALGLLAHRTRGVELSLSSPELTCGVISERAMQRVLFNLFDHALRASATALWVNICDEYPWASIVIGDDGADLTSEELLRMFDPFGCVRVASRGLELHLSRKLVEDAGGTVAARARREGGVEIVLRLPLAIREDVASESSVAARPLFSTEELPPPQSVILSPDLFDPQF